MGERRPPPQKVDSPALADLNPLVSLSGRTPCSRWARRARRSRPLKDLDSLGSCVDPSTDPPPGTLSCIQLLRFWLGRPDFHALQEGQDSLTRNRLDNSRTDLVFLSPFRLRERTRLCSRGRRVTGTRPRRTRNRNPHVLNIGTEVEGRQRR